ncbi:hypothetical protein AB6C62_11535, partial [Vibrio splendidus]
KSAGTAFDGSNPSPSTIFSLIGKSKSQLIELAFFVSELYIFLNVPCRTYLSKHGPQLTKHQPTLQQKRLSELAHSNISDPILQHDDHKPDKQRSLNNWSIHILRIHSQLSVSAEN